MKKKEKYAKYLQRDFELILVLHIIGIILEYISDITLIDLVIRIVDIIFLAFGISYAKKGEKTASIFGIIVSILMILSDSIVSILLGVFMLIHSIVYLTNYDKVQ